LSPSWTRRWRFQVEALVRKHFEKELSNPGNFYFEHGGGISPNFIDYNEEVDDGFGDAGAVPLDEAGESTETEVDGGVGGATFGMGSAKDNKPFFNEMKKVLSAPQQAMFDADCKDYFQSFGW